MTETYQNIAQENLEDLRDDIPEGEVKLQSISIETRSN